jgi:DNA-binding NtrC family response regulator
VCRVLESGGFVVETADAVQSGLSHPAMARCRLVLCDLMLPDGSGMDVLRAARAARPDLPVVLMTGYATAEHAAAAEEAGAAWFVAKPFEAAELLDVVRRVLAHRGAAAEETHR